jgi:hypothetical protein
MAGRAWAVAGCSAVARNDDGRAPTPTPSAIVGLGDRIGAAASPTEKVIKEITA